MRAQDKIYDFFYKKTFLQDRSRTLKKINNIVLEDQNLKKEQHSSAPKKGQTLKKKEQKGRTIPEKSIKTPEKELN